MFVNHTGEGGFTRGRRRVTGERHVTSIVTTELDCNSTGLLGSGLVLSVTAFDVTTSTTYPFAVPITADGTTVLFAFGGLDTYTYTASVLTQPSGPNQICTLSSTSGSLTTGSVTTITASYVTAPPNFWTDFVGTQEL